MKRRIVFLGMLGLMISSFQNCAPAEFRMYPGESKVDVAGDPDPAAPQPTPTPPGSVGVITKACEGAKQSKTLQVQFNNPVDPKNPSKTCPFGVGDNWAMRNGYMQARVEQNFEFDIPAGSKLCGLKMKFPNQKFKFDDMFFLSLNKVVLASSSPIDNYSRPVDGLIAYDWLKIRGQPFGNDNNYQYCLGEKEKKSSCAWPKTETSGTITMDFAPSLFYQIAAADISRTRHELKMTTTGDNDASIDCQHEPISFDLEISYAN